MPLSGTPATLTAQTVQSWRMRKPGPPSHSPTASASRPSLLPAVLGTLCRKVIRAAIPSLRQVPRVITPSAHRLTRTPIRGTRTITKSKYSVRTRLGGRRGTPTFPRARETCDARDVLPNIQLAELDARKLSDYSLKPGHPGNNGKTDGWRALGYDLDNTEGRRDAARELRGLICDELLARGKVAETRDTVYGPSHRVLSGLTGPNGRHATLVTCWLIEERAGLSVPRLTTAWVQPHRDKETER